MATELTQAKVKAQIAWLYKNLLDFDVPKDAVSQELSLTFTDGTAGGEADLAFRDERTLAAGAAETLDLAGVLTDAFGNTLTFVEVTAFVIENRATAAGDDLLIGGGSDGLGMNAWATWLGNATDKVKVPAGGFFMLTATQDPAFTVTAGTGDLLRIANQSATNSVTYRIYILGRSA